MIARNTNEVVSIAAGNGVSGALASIASLFIVVENVSWFGPQSSTGLAEWTLLYISQCLINVTNILMTMTNVTIGDDGSAAEALRVNTNGFAATLPHTGPQSVQLMHCELVSPAATVASGFHISLETVRIQSPIATTPLIYILAPAVTDVALTMVRSHVAVVGDSGLLSRAGVLLIMPSAARVSRDIVIIVLQSYLFWNESCNALLPNTCVTELPTVFYPVAGMQSRALIRCSPKPILPKFETSRTRRWTAIL